MLDSDFSDIVAHFGNRSNKRIAIGGYLFGRSVA